MGITPHSPPYYLRKVNRVTRAYLEDATDIDDIDDARWRAQQEVSSGEFDEVEIVDAADNVVEVVRRAECVGIGLYGILSAWPSRRSYETGSRFRTTRARSLPDFRKVGSTKFESPEVQQEFG